MILKSIAIKNFKIIQDSTFEFDNKFNLIIGNNGMGKTSILEAIVIGLGGFLVGVEGVITIHFSSDDVRRIGSLVGEGSYDIEYFTPTTVTCEADFNGKVLKWDRIKSSYLSSRTTTTKNISKYASEFVKNKSNIFPIISYQSAGRMWLQRRDESEDIFENSYSRIVAYTDCLDAKSSIKMIKNWCKRMEQIAWQRNTRIAEYEAVKKAVSNFINILQDKEVNSTIFYEKRTDELVYSSDNEIIPLRFMSAGYNSLIGMVADIAYRMAVLNPELKHDITNKTNGIVLIDEVDLHIHPKWQWRVVDALTQTFPQVQFIATTHSPIIIASCKDKRIINLYDKDITTGTVELGNENKKTPYGWLVNDVLNEYMDAEERIPEIKAKLEEIEKLSIKRIKKTITDEEKLRLQQLKSEVYSNLPENDAAVELAGLGSIEEILKERGDTNAQG